MIKIIERWADIKGFEGKYQVSNTGKIKSIGYNNTNKEKLLQTQINKKGIERVNLWKGNKAYNFDVALLVARHFLKKENENQVVIHIGDKRNNNVKNLKYGYRSEAKYKKDIGKKNKQLEEVYTKGEIKKYKEIAEKNNISIHQLYKRLYEGWHIEEAIKIPIKRGQRILNKKLYLYQNKFMSVKELSELSGISEKTIYKRLKRGWSIEETMEIPLAKNNKGDK